MVKFIQQLGYTFFVLFSIASLVFFLFSFSFPDPEQMVVGERTDQQTKEAIKKELGLDKSKSQQYFAYINDLSPLGWVNLNSTNTITLFNLNNKSFALKLPYLRRSFQNGKPVTTLLKDAIPGTLTLALSSILMAAFLGILAGIVSALYYNQWPDRILLTLTTAGISVPSFFSAILFAWLFGYVLYDYTHLPMTGSLFDYDPFNGRTLALKNLLLPTLALGIRPLSVVTQLTRNSLKEELSKDYIRTAYAKGLSKKRVIYKHALRNAINPVVTSLSGWFASLLAGAFFVEYIFNWKGLGKVTIEALEKSDLPVVMGSVLFVALLFVSINRVVDGLYRLIDPRIQA
jgi:peptide/nickel transport system permease protein